MSFKFQTSVTVCGRTIIYSLLVYNKMPYVCSFFNTYLITVINTLMKCYNNYVFRILIKKILIFPVLLHFSSISILYFSLSVDTFHIFYQVINNIVIKIISNVKSRTSCRELLKNINCYSLL